MRPAYQDQPYFRSQVTAAGYSDLYLFDAKANLIYSTKKLDDFATSFAKGAPYAATFAGRCLCHRRQAHRQHPRGRLSPTFSSALRRDP